MKRFLLNTGSLLLAILLALLLADVVGVLPPAQPPILCPDESVAVWSTATHEFFKKDFPNLSCRDAEGRPHGPNFNWSDGHLLGMSFWDHGEHVGTTVTFHENRRVWAVRDETGSYPHTVLWSESGVKASEEFQRGDITHFSIWYPNGILKSQGGTVGDSDPFWLPDGSFNEGRKDNTVLVGEYRSYFENGQPKDAGSYRNGARDGEWTCSDEVGEHTVYATYFKGELVSRTGDTNSEPLRDRCKKSSCAQAAEGNSVDPSIAVGNGSHDEQGPVRRCPSRAA